MSGRSRTRFDRFVGERIRVARERAGLTIEELAESIRLSMQAVQKYEAGLTKLPALRLWQITEITGMPIGHFFWGLPDDLRREFTPARRKPKVRNAAKAA